MTRAVGADGIELRTAVLVSAPRRAVLPSGDQAGATRAPWKLAATGWRPGPRSCTPDLGFSPRNET